jgi:hypothetical protein
MLQLGRQEIELGPMDFEALAARRGFELNRRRAVTISRSLGKMGEMNIDDTSFFSMLGFDAVRSCDISNREGCDYLVDLNIPVAPAASREFDAIYDGGTLEHIFNVPQALATIHALLKVGGRVIHASPVSNYVDHGFYTFSPTLFWDYYAANGYEINGCLVTARTSDPFGKALLFSYQPGSLDQFTEGGFGAERFAEYNVFDQFFFATKVAASTARVVPSQSRFLRMRGKADAYGDIPREFLYLGVI